MRDITGVAGVAGEGDLWFPLQSKYRFNLRYSGFETCFGWDPRDQRCRDPIAKHISNPDFAPLN